MHMGWHFNANMTLSTNILSIYLYICCVVGKDKVIYLAINLKTEVNSTM